MKESFHYRNMLCRVLSFPCSVGLGETGEVATVRIKEYKQGIFNQFILGTKVAANPNYN
jgi:hypothetical protein